MRIATLTSLTILLAAGSALAQDAVARKVATEVAARVPLEKPVTGAPYSAETIVENLQVLADGNRISRKAIGRVYRDSEGRTRREEDGQLPIGKNPATGEVKMTDRTTISIVDPVEGFSYSLDPERKIAWRTPINTGWAIMNKVDEMKLAAVKADNERRQAGGDAADKAMAEQKMLAARASESARGGAPEGGVVTMRTRSGEAMSVMTAPQTPLEHRTLDGIAVDGRKTTTVLPAGQVGNEQPLTIVSEEWRSPELNVLVMTHHSDPRSGDSTYRLTNIVRAEPDRSLFMVPSDYEVRDTGVRRMDEVSLRK